MAAVGFTTTELFEAQIEALMKGQHVWTEKTRAIAARRLQAAYDTIVSKLVERGVTAADAATWKLGADFQLDIATYWFGVSNGWMRVGKEEMNWLKAFDRAGELDTVELLDTDFDTIIGADEAVVEIFDISDDED